ncbi:MAG: hypothetical protein RL385_1427 [Pseudomonadota bacterium]
MRKSDGRVRRTRAQWAALVGEWRASGLSGPEFARSHALKLPSWHYWSSTLGRAAERPPPKLLPVHVAPPQLVRGARFELAVGMARLRFDESASPAYIADLARALATASSR